MNVKEKAVVLDAAGDVQFTNLGDVQFLQKSVDVEAMVVCVAFQVVCVQDEPTARPAGQLVEELRVGEFGWCIGQHMNNILEQQGDAIPLLDPENALSQDLQCF